MADAVRSQIRWHAELGANGFDDLKPQDAAENARWRLEAIVRLLDRLDDTARLARVFGVVGMEPDERLKRSLQNGDKFKVGEFKRF